MKLYAVYVQIKMISRLQKTKLKKCKSETQKIL